MFGKVGLGFVGLVACAASDVVTTPSDVAAPRTSATASAFTSASVPPPGSAVAISEPTVTADGKCTVPLGARGVVLLGEREVTPLQPVDGGPPPILENAAVTVDGACPEDCVRVDAIQMEGLLGAARLALGAKTETTPDRSRRVRKNKRRRTLTIQYDGGACSVTDVTGARIANDDRPVFDGAFTAIFNAAIKRPAPLPPD